VAGVSCANSACLGLHRRATHVVPVVHQHGCSQVEGDLALTREILAGLMANPNVCRSVVVGLGCEANQPDILAERARARGASVSVVGIQSSGGVVEAIDHALARLAEPPPEQVTSGLSVESVRVGVMADESSGEIGSEWMVAIAHQLVGRGLRVVMSVPAVPPPAPARQLVASSGVPAVWRRGVGSPVTAIAAIGPSEAASSTVSAGTTDVERLTALAVCGAEVTVVVTASGSPIGSPVAPTVKVSCAAEIDVLDDIVDVAFAGGVGLVERTAEAVDEVIGGRQTCAERWRARDVAIWRIAPYF
jgi:altronate dehydratase large subunit